MAQQEPDVQHPKMSSLQIYIRLLSYVKRYLGIFFLSILGLIIFSFMEIAFIDLFGYTVNAIGGLTADSAAMPENVKQNGGLTVFLVEVFTEEGELIDTRWVVPLIMILIAVVRGGVFFYWWILHDLRITNTGTQS